MKDSKWRSVLKAITWRVIATGTTFTLAYLVFEEWGCEDVLQKSSVVAGLELYLKLVIYYLHERMWQRVSEDSITKVFQTNKTSRQL